MMIINLKKVIYNVYVLLISLLAVFGFVEIFNLEIFYDFADTSWVVIVTILVMIGLKKIRQWSMMTDDK